MPAEAGVFDFSVRATRGSVTGYGRFVLSVTPAPFTVAVADIASALLGGPALPDSVARSVDQIGNRNGVLDVGDLRAYLRAQNQLSPQRTQAQAVNTLRRMTKGESDRLRALVIRGRQ